MAFSLGICPFIPVYFGMPLVPFTFLPDESLVWVFGSQADISGAEEEALLQRVDAFLETWKAHGTPLSAGRNWRDRRFLTIGVDNSQAQASGCSIDGLFREFKALQDELGINLLTNGIIYYRGKAGDIQSADRFDWIQLGKAGDVNHHTIVFDFTVPSLSEWRRSFEKPAGKSWHGSLLPAIAESK